MYGTASGCLLPRLPSLRDHLRSWVPSAPCGVFGAGGGCGQAQLGQLLCGGLQGAQLGLVVMDGGSPLLAAPCPLLLQHPQLSRQRLAVKSACLGVASATCPDWLPQTPAGPTRVPLHSPTPQGVFEHLAEKGQQAPAPVGLQIMVHGTVPTGAPCCASLSAACSKS